jgi:hypothetical protein
MGEKSSPGTRKTDGKNLVWFGEIARKLGQIINAYLYLPFFLLIIVCPPPSQNVGVYLFIGTLVF